MLQVLDETQQQIIHEMRMNHPLKQSQDSKGIQSSRLQALWN